MKNISRKISYLLRHDPEDLIMDKEGWVLTSQLLAKLRIRLTELEEIVASNDKKRFSFNEDKSEIRANQGHSKKLGLDIKFDEVQFPQTYYHGTARKNVVSIMKSGLHSQTRAYVHLSKDVETARKVGLRHSKDIVILEIDGNQMKRDGFKIYESKNEVILVDHVHSEYIKIKK